MAAAEAAAESLAPVETETCPGSWPDFAVVCSFLERYGALLELPEFTFPQLERVLRDTGPVPKVLVELHLKLMRKIGKSVAVERWEKYLTRLCQDFNTTWAWEMEKKGYQEMTVECKLGMLKHLCECQFDDNLKFKNFINEEDADTMRLQPIGRDKDGLMYWYQLDQDHNIRMYIEEQDDQDGTSWKCIVRTRNELAETLELLKAQIDPSLLKKPDQQDGSSNDSPIPNEEDIKPREENVPSKGEELSIKEEKTQEGIKEEKNLDQAIEQKADGEIVKLEKVDHIVKDVVSEETVKETDENIVKEKVDEKIIEDKVIEQSKETRRKTTSLDNKNSIVKIEKSEETEFSESTPKLLGTDSFIDSKTIKFTKEENDSFKENVKPVKVEIKEQKDSDAKNRSDKVSEVERSEISVIVRCSPDVTEKSTEETEKLKNDQQAKIPLKKREIKLTEDFDSRGRGSMCKSVTPTKEMLREEMKMDDEFVKRTVVCALSGTDGKPLVNGEVSNGKLIPLCKTKTVIVNLCSTKEHTSSKEENGIVGENSSSVIKSVATAKTENTVALVDKEITVQGSEKYNHKASLNMDSFPTRKQKGLLSQTEKTVGDFQSKGVYNAEVTTEKPHNDLLPRMKEGLEKPEKSETSLSCVEQTATTLSCIKAPKRTLSCTPEKFLSSSEPQEKPLPSSEPPDKLLFCSKKTEKTLSSSETLEKPLSCNKLQEKPLLCAESAEKSLSCSESPEKPQVCCEPPEKASSCSEPLEDPLSCSEPPEKPLSNSEQSEKPLCCGEPPEKTISCGDLVDKPLSCPEPPEKPLSSSDPQDKPSSFSKPPEKSSSCGEQAKLIVTRKRGLRSRSKRKLNLSKMAPSCQMPPTALSPKGLLTEKSIELDSESSETKILFDGKLKVKSRSEKEQTETTKAKSGRLGSAHVSNEEIPSKTEKKIPLYKSKTKHRLPSEEENSGTESKEMTSERQKDGLKLTIRIANRKKKPDTHPDEESKDVISLQMSEEFKTTKGSKDVESLHETEGHRTKIEIKKAKLRQSSEAFKTKDIKSLTKCDDLEGNICPKMAKSLPNSVDTVIVEEEEGCIGRSLRRSPRISRPSVKVVAVRDQNCDKKRGNEEEKPSTQLPDETEKAKPEKEYLPKPKKPKSRRRRARWTVTRPRRNRKCSSEEESQDSDSEGNFEKDFKVDKDGQESSAPAEDDEPCKKCGLPNHPELILLCDSCDSGYHTACLRPPLMIIPDGEWYCPPCQHKLLCEKLEEQLQNLDVVLKKRERAERRKERLVYVGISLENIIPTQEAEIPEVQEVKKKDTKKVKPLERRSTRTRKCISYRFDEFDEAIDEAIEHDIRDSEGGGGGGFGIGKDMANITAHHGKDMSTILEEERKESKRPQRVAVTRRKKRRRLNDLDSDSNLEDEDESEDEFRISDGSQDDFVVSADNAESDDDLQSNDSDGEIGARKPRRHYARPMRKSRRLRQKIAKRKYSDDDEEEETDEDDNSPDESESNYSEYSDDYLETRRRRSRRNSQRQVNYKEDSESDASKKSVRFGRGKEMRRIRKRRHTSSDSNESCGSKHSENEVLRKRTKHSLRKLIRSSDDEPSEQKNGAPIRKRLNRIETDEDNDDEDTSHGMGNNGDEEKSVSADKLAVPPSHNEGTKKPLYRIESDDEDDFDNVGKVESPLDYSLVDLPSTNGQSPGKTIENLIGKPDEKSQAPKDSTSNTSMAPKGTDNGQDVVAAEEEEDELLSVTDLVDYVCNSEQL